MAEVILISESYLKQLLPEINNNIDIDLIKSKISLCQKMYISKVIGKALYDSILSTISTSGESGLTTNEHTLVYDYLRPLLALYTHRELLLNIAIQMENAGNREKSTPESVQTAFRNVGMLRENVMEQVKFYLNEIELFVKDNQTSFPLYFNNSHASHRAGQKIQTDFGFYLPKRIDLDTLDEFDCCDNDESHIIY